MKNLASTVGNQFTICEFILLKKTPNQIFLSKRVFFAYSLAITHQSHPFGLDSKKERPNAAIYCIIVIWPLAIA